MYHYSCRSCHRSTTTDVRADNLGPCICGNGIQQRRWSVNYPAPFTPHFNHSIGSYVTSSRDFDEKLKARGEESGTTFSRLDPGDMPRPTTDDGIFDTQMKTLTDRGYVGSDGVTLDDSGNFIPK